MNLGDWIDQTESFWSLIVGSHSGQIAHILELKNLAEALQVPLEALQCPCSYPMDQEATCVMRQQGTPPSRLHHPCAGKHLGVLGAAFQAKVDVTSYLSPDHPIQRRIKSAIETRLGHSCAWVTDSCGLPTAVVTAQDHLNLWSALAQDQSTAAATIKRVWLKSPLLAGGKGRLDTELMEAFPGQLLAKEGADGLLALQFLADSSQETLLIKLASGYNSKFLALGLYATLMEARKLSDLLQQLASYLRSRLNEFIPEGQTLQLFERQP